MTDAIRNARLIPLSQGLFAIVDEDDYDRVSQYNWIAMRIGSGMGYFYAARTFRKNGKKHFVKLADFVMKCPSNKIVDHIHHRTLDNRKSELRKCTHQQNCWNRQKCKKATSSQYKGVYWHKSNKLWRVQINIKGRQTDMGGYGSELEAALVFDAKAKQHQGSFACLNFPQRQLAN